MTAEEQPQPVVEELKAPAAPAGDEKKAAEVAGPTSPGEDKEATPLLLFLLCSISTLEGADMALLPAVFFALQQDLGLSLNDLATMTLFQAVCQAAAAPFWGVLADRGIVSRKKILIFGSVVQGAITCVLAGVDKLVPMVVLRALNGAVLASLRPVGNGVLADVTSEAKRGKVYGWVFFALNIGMMVGALVGTPISTTDISGFQGWRVSFIGIGSLSILVGVLLALFMTEPEREGAKLQKQGGIMSELRRLVGYCRMPTFLSLVLQGCFGCVPWNAMGYRTLFFQVGGIDGVRASLLQALGQVAGALGALFGGVLADTVTRRWLPLHGRPLVAQISVFAGIPIACLTFMIVPPSGDTAFWYYLSLVCLLGLTASWCATGVNLPILSEIVPADNRSAIMAWQTALEGSCAAVLGNAMVGILAQNVFGYDLSNSNAEYLANPENQAALGKALTLTVCFPWVICLVFYSLLHWSYPRDLKYAQSLRAAPAAARKEVMQVEGVVVGAEPAKDPTADKLPQGPRVAQSAAAAAANQQ